MSQVQNLLTAVLQEFNIVLRSMENMVWRHSTFSGHWGEGGNWRVAMERPHLLSLPAAAYPLVNQPRTGAGVGSKWRLMSLTARSCAIYARCSPRPIHHLALSAGLPVSSGRGDGT